ncbi:hypothetical protein MMC25_001215 [Agyrium rufum]|nr:hypothetical protein [Agyrium rufum]
MAAPSNNPSNRQRHNRTASKLDINHIWVIDSSATKKFGSIPALADLAAGEETTEKFERWLEHGRVYLVEDKNRPVGFVAVHEVDDVLYIDEIGVHENHQGRGLGAMLLEAVFQRAQEIAWEKNREVARVSLTTYPDVPWNGPWYKKHGFEEFDAERIGPWHVDEVQYLARPGYRRCCMLWEKRVVADELENSG